MHGHGVIVLANGDIYDGAWANGMMEGSGTFKFKTGLYIGEMVQGLREGAGVLQMENGTKYTGQFQQNKYHGEVRSQTALEIVERGDHLSADGRQSCRRAGALMCVRARGWLVSEWLGSNVRGVGRRRESCDSRVGQRTGASLQEAFTRGAVDCSCRAAMRTRGNSGAGTWTGPASGARLRAGCWPECLREGGPWRGSCCSAAARFGTARSGRRWTRGGWTRRRSGRRG
jgi:hypothetical protein